MSSPFLFRDKTTVLERFGAAQIEFLSEDMLVTIVPLFSYASKYQLASVTCGPFRPNVAARVPLWLAKQLKKKNMCKIQPPDWLDATELGGVLERERADTSSFQPLPYHFIELATQILEVAQDDVAEASIVRELVESIWEARHLKLMATMGGIAEAPAVMLTNLSGLETNAIRAFLASAMSQFQRLHEAEAAGATPASQLAPLRASAPVRRGAASGSAAVDARTPVATAAARELMPEPAVPAAADGGADGEPPRKLRRVVRRT